MTALRRADLIMPDNSSVPSMLPEHSNFGYHGPHLSNSPIFRCNYPPTREDWHNIKPIFNRLYLKERKQLKHVMTELEGKYGFKSKPKTFRNRLGHWNIKRNVNYDEALQIIAIEAARKAQGKNTDFYLRGELVDMKQPHQYWRRRKLSTSDAITRYALGQYKPSTDLIVRSPSPRYNVLKPVQSEQSFEQCLFEYHYMILSLVEYDICTIGPNGIRKEGEPNHDEIWNVVHSVKRDTAMDHPNEYFLILRRFSFMLEHAIDAYEPGLWFKILDKMALIFDLNVEFGRAIHKYLGSLIETKLTWSDPRYKFFTALTQMAADRMRSAVEELRKLHWQIELNCGPNDRAFILRCHLRCYEDLSFQGIHTEPGKLLGLLQGVIGLFGHCSYESLSCLELLFTHPCSLIVVEQVKDFVNWVRDRSILTTSNQGLILAGKTLRLKEAERLLELYLSMREFETARIAMQCMHKCADYYNLTTDDLWAIWEWLHWYSSGSYITKESMECREQLTSITDHWHAEVEASRIGEDLLAHGLTGKSNTIERPLHRETVMRRGKKRKNVDAY
ncbi:hypothetical protein H2198_002465 [Neophaeococcomyces mojaviensis]|uniref:Uncharacterized protein n=1 Tax=Neophaeococcomyces mojaviensis TaxID=3383035 RepID=A0ACC3AE16_9EURO|nr:hypothetical protein H2198_002465 [Knufia sp. JES_112]